MVVVGRGGFKRVVKGSFYREFVAMRVAGRVASVLRWDTLLSELRWRKWFKVVLRMCWSRNC